MRSLVLAAALVACAPARAAGEGDGGAFAETRTIDGRTFVVTGTGVRKGDYAMALYVDELDARRAFPALAARAGGRQRARLLAGDHAQTFLLWGHFTKVAVFRFQRAMTAEAFGAPIRAELDRSPEQRKQVEALLAAIDRDFAEGEELVLRTDDDGRIEWTLGGERKAGPRSPKLQRALWALWLGSKAELRRALVEKIDLLGR